MPTGDLGNIGRLFVGYDEERRRLADAEQQINTKLGTPGLARPVSDLDPTADQANLIRPANIAPHAQSVQGQNIAPSQPSQQGGGVLASIGNAVSRFGQGFLQGMGADVHHRLKQAAMIEQQTKLYQGQVALQQYEVQQAQRLDAARKNYEPAKVKVKHITKLAQNELNATNKERKAQGLPELPMTMSLMEAKAEEYNKNVEPDMQFGKLDLDTMTLTGQGRLMMAELGILPAEELNKVNSAAQQAQNTQRLELEKRIADALNPSSIFGNVTELGPMNKSGTPFPPTHVLHGEGKQLQQLSGLSEAEFMSRTGNVPLGEYPTGQVDPQTGQQIVQQTPGRIPVSKFKDRMLGENNLPLMEAVKKAREAQLAAQATLPTELAKKAKDPDPTMTGAEANAELRRQIAPVSNKPEDITLWDDNEVVTAKQFDQTAKEFSNNLRKATTVEHQNFRAQEKLTQQRNENVENRNLRRELQQTTNENIHRVVDKKHDLAKVLQSRAQDFQIKRDQNKFTQEEKQEQFRADAAIERQRERLQTQAGIAFTRDAIRNNPDDALKFALEAERQGGATTRGVLGSLLKTNPGLAWPLMKRMAEGEKLSGTTMDAVKGAVADYLGNLAEGGVQAEIDQVLDGAGTDQTKKLKLVGIKNRQKPGTKEYDLAQTYLDALKDEKSGITINNLPTPPEEGGALDATTRRKYISAIHENTTGVSSMNALLNIIDKTPVSGVAGLAQQVKNFFVGTAYDIDALRENVDEETFAKRFNPDVEAGVYMANLVQYAVARSNEPGGRLTDRDIDRVKLGVSSIRSTQQLKAALLKARSEILSKNRQHSDLLKIGGLKFTPDPIDRDMIIDNFANDPQIAQMSEREALDLIQLTLQESSGVAIGNVDAREMLRDIRKRNKRR